MTLADIQGSMDLSRIPNPTRKDYARLGQDKQVEQILRTGLDVQNDYWRRRPE